jgi:hypothetical protein
MRTKALGHGAFITLMLCCALSCRSRSTVPLDAVEAASASASAQPAPPAASAPAPAVDPAPWLQGLQGPAMAEGTRFGLASCFSETKHCIQFPMGWKTDGRAQAMGDGRIAWAHRPNRHACVAIDRGGSDWAELISRDEAGQKGFSEPAAVLLGTDGIASSLRVARLEMGQTRPYPYNILLWFACFGVEAGTTATVAEMPAGPASLLVLKAELKPGLTFNVYGFLSDAASDEEKRDLLATIRGIRSAPGRLATHPK